MVKAQFGHAAEYHRRSRRPEGHGTRRPEGHNPAVARRGGGTTRHEGLLRPVTGYSRMSMSCCSRTSARIWVHRTVRPLVAAWCRSNTRLRVKVRTLPARPWRGRSAPRRGWNSWMSVGTSAGSTFASRNVLTTSLRPAGISRMSCAERLSLVFFPRDRLRTHHGPVPDRGQHGQSRDDDDRHDLHLAVTGKRMAGTLQQADRRSDVRKHQEGRLTAVVGRRSDAREGPSAGVEKFRSRAWQARSKS